MYLCITKKIFVLGLSKKLVKISQNKECEKLQTWLGSIRKHMYWTAASSSSGPERVAKWTSILNHVGHIQTHEEPLYPQCLHKPRTSRDKGKWLTEGAFFNLLSKCKACVVFFMYNLYIFTYLFYLFYVTAVFYFDLILKHIFLFLFFQEHLPSINEESC